METPNFDFLAKNVSTEFRFTVKLVSQIKFTVHIKQ